jgi:hypothetical protein
MPPVPDEEPRRTDATGDTPTNQSTVDLSAVDTAEDNRREPEPVIMAGPDVPIAGTALPPVVYPTTPAENRRDDEPVADNERVADHERADHERADEQLLDDRRDDEPVTEPVDEQPDERVAHDEQSVDAQSVDERSVDAQSVDERHDEEPLAAPFVAPRAADTIDDEPAPDFEPEPVAEAVPAPETAAPPVPEEQAETEPAAGDLKPGDVEAVPIAALWGDGTADQFRDRWRDAQLRFIDDPQHAANEAKAIVGEAIDKLTESLANQRTDLDGWEGDASGGDTERLRVAVQRYRDFLDRLLGL